MRKRIQKASKSHFIFCGKKERISFPDGGNLTRILRELEESGFIRVYSPVGEKRNGALYQLCDPFVAFHLTWLEKAGAGNEDVWSALMGSGAYNAWSGYAFEQETKSRKALRITMVTTYGVQKNQYSSVVQSEVRMEDLFS